MRQGAPSTIRCIETLPTEPAPRRQPGPVREHPAPSGALRPGRVARERLGHGARGGRPTSIAMAPRADAPSVLLRALSAVRCAHKGPELGNVVRTQGRNQAVVCGAVLRNSVPCVRNRELRPKGACGTIRCIETCPGCRPGRTRCRVRRYLAPSGASRLVIGRLVVRIQPQSGSTQHHRVH